MKERMSEFAMSADKIDCLNFYAGFQSLDEYLDDTTKDSTWGDGIMLSAASMYYQCPLSSESRISPTRFKCQQREQHNHSWQ